MSGERNTVELEGGFHGVEGVVMVKKDFGDQFGVV